MATPRRSARRSASRDPVTAPAPSSVGRTPGRRLRSNAGSIDGESNAGGSRISTRAGGTEQGGSRVTVPIQPTTSYGTEGQDISPPLLHNLDNASSAQNMLNGAIVEATTSRHTTRVLTTIVEGEGGVGDDATSEPSSGGHSRRGIGGHRSVTQTTLGLERGYAFDATFNQTQFNAAPAANPPLAHAPPLRWWNRIIYAIGNGMITTGDAMDDAILAVGTGVRQAFNNMGNTLTAAGTGAGHIIAQAVGDVLHRLPNPIVAIGFAARQFYQYNPLRYFLRYWKVCSMSLLLIISFTFIEPDLSSAETLQRGPTSPIRFAGGLRNRWNVFTNQISRMRLPHLQLPHISLTRSSTATLANDATCTPCDFDSAPLNEAIRQINTLKEEIRIHSNDIDRHDDHLHLLQSSSALHDQLLDRLEKTCCNRPYSSQEYQHAINYFATGNGAIVDPYLTSPTKLARKLTWKEWRLAKFQGVYFRSSPGPVAALMPWDDVGDCWCAPPSRGKSQITVAMPYAITPTTLIVEHIDKGATLDIGSAPKEIELWVEILDDTKRENIVNALSEMYSQDHAFNIEPNDQIKAQSAESFKKYLSWAQALPPTFVKVGKWNYSIFRNSPYGQPMHIDIDLGRFGVDTNRVSIRVNNNYGGGDYTCIYRLKLNGEISDEQRPQYFTGTDQSRTIKKTYLGVPIPF